MAHDTSFGPTLDSHARYSFTKGTPVAMSASEGTNGPASDSPRIPTVWLHAQGPTPCPLHLRWSIRQNRRVMLMLHRLPRTCMYVCRTCSIPSRLVNCTKARFDSSRSVRARRRLGQRWHAFFTAPSKLSLASPFGTPPLQRCDRNCLPRFTQATSRLGPPACQHTWTAASASPHRYSNHVPGWLH